MHFLSSMIVVLAQTDVQPSATSVGLELSIWKWVVMIAIGAVALIYGIKRLGDVSTDRKTKQMINEVVGEGESVKNTDWQDDDE